MRKVLPMSRIREMEPYMDAKVLDYIHEGQIEAFEGFEDFDLIAFDWYDVRSERTAASQMLLYLDREDLFVFCEDDAAEDAAQAALLVPEEEALSNEQVLHRFFVRLLRGDMAHLDRLEAEALAIQAEDMDMCEKISRYGLSLLHPGDGVLTHCNAGPLATSCYGTGQGPLHLAAKEGFPLKIFADETRPLLQGARLTAYELQQAGADVTLICDNMASLVMKNGWIQACMVGCDRVAANGDTANKIGTSGVAILAHHYQIPFYVLGPTSTIDLSCPTGADIPIEERSGEEIRSLFYKEPQAPAGITCYNPAFDVTDHTLITAIITEKGICRPPYTQSLAALF